MSPDRPIPCASRSGAPRRAGTRRGLALTDARVAHERVRVHQRELVQQQPQRAVVPARVRHPPLRQQRLHHVSRAPRLLRLAHVAARDEPSARLKFASFMAREEERRRGGRTISCVEIARNDGRHSSSHCSRCRWSIRSRGAGELQLIRSLGAGRSRRRSGRRAVHTCDFGDRLLPSSRSLASRRQWFEGWFFRLTDHRALTSVAVVFGSLRRPNEPPPAAFSEHIVVVAYRDGAGVARTEAAYLDAGAVRIRGGAADAFDAPAIGGGGPRVSWWSDEHGGMVVEGDRAMLGGGGLAAGGERARARAVDAARPDAAGPEGWLARTGLLPCHYLCTASAAGALPPAPPRRLGRRRRRGDGARRAQLRRHVSDGVGVGAGERRRRRPHLILTGGRFVIGPLTTRSYVLGVRAGALALDFRTTDLDRVEEAPTRAPAASSSTPPRATAAAGCGCASPRRPPPSAARSRCRRSTASRRRPSRRVVRRRRRPRRARARRAASRATSASTSTPTAGSTRRSSARASSSRRSSLAARSSVDSSQKF